MSEETQYTTVVSSAYVAVDTDAAYKQVTQNRSGNEIKHNWFVLKSLVSKDFKLKYRRSVLGVLWSVLNPLLMMVILAIVFTYAFKFQIENFPLYLILGNILFDFMNRGTTGALESVIAAQSLIKKIRISKMIFPLEKVSFELVNFAISLIAAAVVMAVFRVVPSIHAIWALPFIVVVTTIFAMGLGLLISALAVFFRDMMHLWGVLMTAWMYFTPLFYPVEVLPDVVQQAMWFNPMYHYVTYFRSIMMWNTNPGGVESLLCLGMALVTFLVGFLVFRKLQSKFILYV
ncbi:MAG TPA: ABC transporter [Eggerthellaceae bacterium]|nr:ABC transporter [Eggerthellaceae bacterium]